MKKIIIALLLAALVVCPLVGCTVGTESEKKPITDVSSGSGEPSEKGSSEEPSKEAESPETSPEKPTEKLSIEEQVCFEHEGIKVTAKSITDDSIFGTGIKLLVENDTEKDYTVSTDEVIVNNCMVSSLFSCKVAAGKKGNDTLYLSSSSLEAAGITNIGQIEIYFYIYDSESYETVYKAECTTIRTSLYDKMDTAVNDAGKELYNKDGIRIVGKYVDENTFWGSAVLLYIENKSEKNITVSCDDLSINGFMVSSFLSSTVYTGKYSIDDITILSDSLEENGITSIDTVELKFHIFDPDSYQTIVDTDPITFSTK